MLTIKQIRKISRLLEQTGESRPGFLHDGADNLEGPALCNTFIRDLPATSPNEVSCRIQGTEYIVDNETGDLRLVLIERKDANEAR